MHLERAQSKFFCCDNFLKVAITCIVANYSRPHQYEIRQHTRGFQRSEYYCLGNGSSAKKQSKRKWLQNATGQNCFNFMVILPSKQLQHNGFNSSMSKICLCVHTQKVLKNTKIVTKTLKWLWGFSPALFIFLHSVVTLRAWREQIIHI